MFVSIYGAEVPLVHMRCVDNRLGEKNNPTLNGETKRIFAPIIARLATWR